MDERLIGRILKGVPLAGALALSVSCENAQMQHAPHEAGVALCAAPYEMRGQFVQPILDAVEEARTMHRPDIGERIMGCPDAEVNMAITVSQERVLRSPYTTLDAEKGRAEILDILLQSRRAVDERRTQAANGVI